MSNEPAEPVARKMPRGCARREHRQRASWALSEPPSALVGCSFATEYWGSSSVATGWPRFRTVSESRAAGNLENFRRLVDAPETVYRGSYPFLDTDGYLGTAFQGAAPLREQWADLAWGHELYNFGHRAQAAAAASRQLGDDRLTGERAYLRQAQLFVDRRGRSTEALHLCSRVLPGRRPTPRSDSVTGHAVRMVYLAAGATDVAVETEDPALLAHLDHLWDDMVATKSKITGGLGARHSDEAFGDRYELPSERAYAETCAETGAMQPLEVHALSIGGGDDPVRLRFTATPGAGVVVGMSDLGDRFRLTLNEIDVVEPDEALPRLPVACAVWKPRPSLSTSAESWLLAGGPHHTVFSTAVGLGEFRDFAEMTQTELVEIGQTTTTETLRQQLRWSAAYHRLAARL